MSKSKIIYVSSNNFIVDSSTWVNDICYRYKDTNYIFQYSEPSNIKDMDNVRCYLNLKGKKTVFEGRMTKGKFTPYRHCNHYSKYLREITTIRRTKYFSTLRKACEVFLETLI